MLSGCFLLLSSPLFTTLILLLSSPHPPLPHTHASTNEGYGCTLSCTSIPALTVDARPRAPQKVSVVLYRYLISLLSKPTFALLQDEDYWEHLPTNEHRSLAYYIDAAKCRKSPDRVPQIPTNRHKWRTAGFSPFAPPASSRRTSRSFALPPDSMLHVLRRRGSPLAPLRLLVV